MELFYHEFKRCLICDNNMDSNKNRTWRFCKNGCCHYDVYLRDEYVRITLFEGGFDESYHYVRLHEKTKHRGDTLDSLLLHEIILLEKIEYWKENDRYLIRVLEIE